jgi:hypothetical protein
MDTQVRWKFVDTIFFITDAHCVVCQIRTEAEETVFSVR